MQVEVDGGYKSRNAIYLVEAKTGGRADFHIRQLYYPNLEWKPRAHRHITPIFFVVTNGKFCFFEFRFDLAFGLYPPYEWQATLSMSPPRRAGTYPISYAV